MIRKLPDDATLEEIIAAIRLRMKVERGIQELDEGRGIPHEQAMARLQRWLK